MPRQRTGLNPSGIILIPPEIIKLRIPKRHAGCVFVNHPPQLLQTLTRRVRAVLLAGRIRMKTQGVTKIQRLRLPERSQECPCRTAEVGCNSASDYNCAGSGIPDRASCNFDILRILLAGDADVRLIRQFISGNPAAVTGSHGSGITFPHLMRRQQAVP